MYVQSVQYISMYLVHFFVPSVTRSDFCNGATDMLMGGFGVAGNEDNPCIILFFPSWKLVRSMASGAIDTLLPF